MQYSNNNLTYLQFILSINDRLVIKLLRFCAFKILPPSFRLPGLPEYDHRLSLYLDWLDDIKILNCCDKLKFAILRIPDSLRLRISFSSCNENYANHNKHFLLDKLTAIYKFIKSYLHWKKISETRWLQA